MFGSGNYKKKKENVNENNFLYIWFYIKNIKEKKI